MSTVIKATERNRAIHGVAFNFDDLSSNADSWLQKVRDEAQRIVQKAQQEADLLRRKAEAEGRQAALAEVERLTEKQVAQQMQSALPALERAIAEIDHSKQAFLAEWERNVVKLAAGMAARVIRRELSHAPQIPLELVRESLELCVGGSQVRVLLNPQDEKTLRTQVTQLSAQFSRLGTAELIADEAIAPGGCRVETRFGAIDQQFESQLARIVQELT